MTFTFPQNAYGNRRRPFRLISDEGVLLGHSEVDDVDVQRKLSTIRTTIVDLYNFLHDKLPVGCPMIIGGGFIRDAVLGGQIGDIDIWLPSQATLEAHHIYSDPHFRDTDVIFQLNHMGMSGLNTIALQANREDYRDLSNLLVVESLCNDIKVNFIKSMTAWETPEQFFERMFRNFDTEISMFFIGLLPQDGQNAPITQFEDFDQSCLKTVILPSSYREIASEGDTQEIIAINPERVNITSEIRMNTRYSKLTTRYNLVRDDNLRYEMGVNDFYPIRILFTDFDQQLLELMPRPRQ